HHERQKDQHHDGVGGHLLAVRPDDLAELTDDFAQVVHDVRDGVATRALGGLLGLLLAFSAVLERGRFLSAGRDVGVVGTTAPGPLSGGSRRLRRYGAGAFGLVAHRMPFIWFVWSPTSVHTCRVFVFSRGDRT